MTLFDSDGSPDTSTPDHVLPIGTRIDSFRITGVIGEGGFGVVYRAYDAILQREVALKEYLPVALAARADRSARVLVRSSRSRPSFEAGLQGFVNEARMLARFDHPALVKVHRFWEGNGTAYMAMPYYEGPTLKQLLAEQRVVVDEALLRGWLEPLLDALETLHAAGCLHRDIAPDNIVITTGGPVLLDVGAARQIIGDTAKGLTVLLKPGFAPVEQYGETSNTPQGPWTDIYALAAVISTAITGHPPAAAVERVLDDHQPLLWRTQIGRYRQTFLHAVDTALAVRPEQRPQSIAQWREMFAVPPPPPVLAARAPRRTGLWAASAVAALMLVLAFGHQSGETAREHDPTAAPASADRPAAEAADAAQVTAADATDPAALLALQPPAAGPTATVAAGVTPGARASDAREAAPRAGHAATSPAAGVAEEPMAGAFDAAAPVARPSRPAQHAAASPPRPATPTPAVRSVAAAPRANATAPRRDSPACRALIQKASLQSLSADEADLLKKECR